MLVFESANHHAPRNTWMQVLFYFEFQNEKKNQINLVVKYLKQMIIFNIVIIIIININNNH